jgi:ABC-type nitrate/sulfonate/bicarbonate transport system substrate-binding protein
VAPGIPVAAAYAMPKYASSGVTIKDVPVASGPVELAGLLSGQIQVAPIGYATYIQALAKGDKLTAVAGVADGGLEIVASKKLVPAGDINAAQAAYTGSAPWALLAGKTIATLPGTYPDMACRQYLDSHGIDLSQIKFVTAASFSEEMNLVEDGTVDAACGLDPWPLAARASNKLVLLGYPYPSLTNYLAYSTVLAVSTDEVTSHPEVVQAAVEALVNATTALNQGDDKTTLVDTIATYLPVPKDVLALGVSSAAAGGKDPKFWLNTVLSNNMNNKSTAQLVPLELKLGLIQGDQATIEQTVTASFDYTFLAKATGKSAADVGSGQ